MTQDVLIAIKGLQFGEEEEENAIESIISGSYYERNGSRYLLYEEVSEGFDEITKNMIKIKEKEMVLTKKGLVNVQMVFEENRKNLTNYNMPFGDIMLGIDTKKIEIMEQSDDIRIMVDYSLEVNYQHYADCNIDIHIRSKENGEDLF